MRVGVIQSDYIPWRGYFDFIDDVDLFIFYDDLQYSKGSWRNRNKIKTTTGVKWISVPIKHGRLLKSICETSIDHSQNWQEKHLNQLHANYMKSPFVNDAMGILKEGLSFEDITISELNIRLIRLVCAYLQIDTPMVMSFDYVVTGTKTERLINLLNKVGATVYLSGPTAKEYLDENLFRKHGIRLEYKSYDYIPYPQLWGEFAGNVTVLDLIANTGMEARHYLKSQVPNVVAIE